MVVLHVKRPERLEFCYETTLVAGVGDVAVQLVELHNTVCLLHQLGAALEAAGESGGAAPYAEAVQLLAGVAAKVGGRAPITKQGVLAELDRMQAALLTATPQGLPAGDPVRQLVDALYGTGNAGEECRAGLLDAAHTTLWFAGKAMQASKTLGDYLGRHEKTRAVVKLEPSGAGAPPREPVLDPETQQAMTAWYYQKQQEQQRMALEDAESVGPPGAWASSSALKEHFTGVSKIKIR